MFILVGLICYTRGSPLFSSLWELTLIAGLQREGTAKCFLFAAEVHSLDNSQSEAFAKSSEVW